MSPAVRFAPLPEPHRLVSPSGLASPLPAACTATGAKAAKSRLLPGRRLVAVCHNTGSDELAEDAEVSREKDTEAAGTRLVLSTPSSSSGETDGGMSAQSVPSTLPSHLDSMEAWMERHSSRSGKRPSQTRGATKPEPGEKEKDFWLQLAEERRERDHERHRLLRGIKRTPFNAWFQEHCHPDGTERLPAADEPSRRMAIRGSNLEDAAENPLVLFRRTYLSQRFTFKSLPRKSRMSTIALSCARRGPFSKGNQKRSTITSCFAESLAPEALRQRKTMFRVPQAPQSAPPPLPSTSPRKSMLFVPERDSEPLLPLPPKRKTVFFAPEPPCTSTSPSSSPSSSPRKTIFFAPQPPEPVSPLSSSSASQRKSISVAAEAPELPRPSPAPSAVPRRSGASPGTARSEMLEMVRSHHVRRSIRMSLQSCKGLPSTAAPRSSICRTRFGDGV